VGRMAFLKANATLLAILLTCWASSAVAAPPICPINVPVVTLAPHQSGGFSWGNVIRPMGDPCVSRIGVEPANASAWYVGGFNGLYMTRDGGITWTHPLTGQVLALLLVPGQPLLVYAGIDQKVFLSRDHGQNWTAIRTFAHPVESLLVANGKLYAGLGWSSHAEPSGIWTSNLGGGFPQFTPFGAGHTGLIVWSLVRDPLSGTIYAGTEIFDHPQPYKPPFFRSANGGSTWLVTPGTLPSHVVASAVRPSDGFLYALTETPGLFGSPDKGTTWQPPQNLVNLGISLLMDPKHTTRLFAGRQKDQPPMDGGIFVSIDSGKIFKQIGLPGVTVGGLAVNGTATKLYAATYGSGIYISPLP
jgi:hypothetical protein